MFRIRIILMRIRIRGSTSGMIDPDPGRKKDQRFLKRIRIRANDTDPTGSGSETLTIIINYNNYVKAGECDTIEEAQAIQIE